MLQCRLASSVEHLEVVNYSVGHLVPKKSVARGVVNYVGFFAEMEADFIPIKEAD